MAVNETAFDEDENRSALARFFGVIFDPRAYGALVYMLLALATGIAYFTWVAVGVSLSLGLMILIIGIPLAILFLGSVRVLSLVESYIVTFLLGADIPHAEPFEPGEHPLWERVKRIFTDYRTWTSLFYMVLMLALGIIYFTLAVTGLAVVVSLIAAPAVHYLTDHEVNIQIFDDGEHIPYLVDAMANYMSSPIGAVANTILGVLLLFVLLHVARAIGRGHAKIAEAMLVRI